MPGVSTEQVTYFREVKEIAEKSLNQFSFKLAEWLISGLQMAHFISFSNLVKYSN